MEAGWYAVLRIPAVKGDDETALELLNRGVSVHPGYYFGFPGCGVAGGEPTLHKRNVLRGDGGDIGTGAREEPIKIPPSQIVKVKF